MLKALELVGFKSFADKTRFEFPPGITAVVGPNGSGKSNVVDAIKWVLGEQSVKSLRGKEMADVIFNGSGTRHGLNAAEATLTFENAARVLPIDGAEVHITRRVYRNGEGEYLINRQPSRLRDIRDLLSGTGAATEAYSVIEQGKVDILLQSSARDRRGIFEEAAGISRFKAKKTESLRRLERVEQNLLRLSDIVEEVSSRLRSIRLQANKARRYKELADRLQELRIQVGLAEWRRLSIRINALTGDLQSIGDRRDQAAARAEAFEAQSIELETSIAERTEEIRKSELSTAEARHEIGALESMMNLERVRLRETDEEASRHYKQLASMNVRAGDLAQQLHETTLALQDALEQRSAHERFVIELEKTVAESAQKYDVLRRQHDEFRQQALECTRVVAALGSEVAALESQHVTAHAARDRGRQRIEDLDSQSSSVNAQADRLESQIRDLMTAVDKSGARWAAAQADVREVAAERSAVLDELGRLRERQSGLAERLAVLEELEQRQEGIGAGVREILASVRQAPSGPWAGIQGLVADLFHVQVEMAPLIELALGERTQFLVVRAGPNHLDVIIRESKRLPGRVGFIRLDAAPGEDWQRLIDLTHCAGVVARADRLVEVEPALAPLAQRLLGSTWIVDQLTTALALWKGVGSGQSFVTLAGDRLWADGAIAVGPRHTVSGLITRRSELRVLRQQREDWGAAIQRLEESARGIDGRIEQANLLVQSLAAAHQKAADDLGEHRLQAGAVHAHQAQLSVQRRSLVDEYETALEQCGSSTVALAAARQRLEAAEAQLTDAVTAGASLSARMVEQENLGQRCQREVTTARVELAKREERLEHLRARQGQFQADKQERSRTIADRRAQLAMCGARRDEAQAAILRAESHVALLYLLKEGQLSHTVRLAAARDLERESRAQVVERAQTARAEAHRLQEEYHAQELILGQLGHERGALESRLRDDYAVELADLAHPATPEEVHQREQVEQEIAELRRKINQIGPVNLEALAELNELEARHAGLAAQYDDLNQARQSLSQIIGKINDDSRRLFADTLETVKGHFQGLFRKLFGGGHADIVLEEGVDILESGIEIVARPPGKEPRNISLLSGGEKTLTCVALLLAIFQYRPSPFCVLDEVDAALDEANIERFIVVLKEFLAWTQFIVVTHSKKTMTCANTLYGVTMQESGVSKRVSVRFEDVSEDGEIRISPPADTQAA